MMAATPNHKPTCRHTIGYLLRKKLKVTMLSPFFYDNRKKTFDISLLFSFQEESASAIMGQLYKNTTHAMAAHAQPLAARSAAMHSS